MTTKLVAVGSIKDGAYIIIDGLPCTVKSVQVSKTGKHGHAKCRIEAVGIIGDRQMHQIGGDGIVMLPKPALGTIQIIQRVYQNTIGNRHQVTRCANGHRKGIGFVTGRILARPPRVGTVGFAKRGNNRLTVVGRKIKALKADLLLRLTVIINF